MEQNSPRHADFSGRLDLTIRRGLGYNESVTIKIQKQHIPGIATFCKMRQRFGFRGGETSLLFTSSECTDRDRGKDSSALIKCES